MYSVLRNLILCFRFRGREPRLQVLRTLLIMAMLACLSASVQAQENFLCVGNYWSEDEANVMMKRFEKQWEHNLPAWEKRAEVIRRGIIEGMKLDQMPDIKGNFHARITASREFDGYVVENIMIQSFPGFYITGNLYRPLNPEPKSAAILCPHGHFDDPQNYARFRPDVQKRCATLARMGAVVFAYDMAGYGDCRQVDHRRMPIGALLQTWNSRRVLEYLISRPDVDPERIGMTGASAGGYQTFILAAIDDRVKVSVPVVMIAAHYFGVCLCESGMPIYRSAHHQTNNVEIAALCAPRPMMFISDGVDFTRNSPQVEYPYIQKVYALYNAEHKVKNIHLADENHDYGYSKRKYMYPFMAHYLGLHTGKVRFNPSADEGFVTILSQDQLRVYTEKDPMPADALKGNDAVIDYLGQYVDLSEYKKKR